MRESGRIRSESAQRPSQRNAMRMVSEDVLLLRRQGSSAVEGKREIRAIELPQPRGAEGVAAQRECTGCVSFGEEFDV